MAKKLITKDQLAATVERVAANISEVAGAAAEAIEEMGSEMGGATANTAGTGGMVPAPAAGDQDKFLRGDGTWATPEGGGGKSCYGTCSTVASTQTKAVTISGFELVTGAQLAVKFTVTNTASSPKLDVNSTGAKPIYYRGTNITSSYLAANRTYLFVYNGTQYELIGDINTDTQNTSASNLTSGTLSVARGGTGQNTLTSGSVLVGNGTSAVTFKSIDTTSGGTSGATSLITSGAVNSGLSNKADKSTTLARYGITDAYTKTEVDNKTLDTELVSAVNDAFASDDDFENRYAAQPFGSNDIYKMDLSHFITDTSGKVSKYAKSPFALSDVSGLSLTNLVDGTNFEYSGTAGISGTVIRSGSASYNVNNGISRGYVQIASVNYRRVLRVKASISSQSGYDYGGCIISTDSANTTFTLANLKSSSTAWFYISGTVSARDYCYVLEANTTYYANFGYAKNSSTNTGDDRFYIHEISVDPVTDFEYSKNTGVTGCAVQNGSSTYRIEGGISRGYVKIDPLPVTSELYVLASISSKSNTNYGGCIVTENEPNTTFTLADLKSSAVAWFNLTGTKSEQTFVKELYPNKTYYLNFGYGKTNDSELYTIDDRFSIHSIRVNPIVTGNNKFEVAQNMVFTYSGELADTVVTGLAGKCLSADTSRHLMENSHELDELDNKYLKLLSHFGDYAVRGSTTELFWENTPYETTLTIQWTEAGTKTIGSGDYATQWTYYTNKLYSSLSDSTVSLTSDSTQNNISYGYRIVKLSDCTGFIVREGYYQVSNGTGSGVGGKTAPTLQPFYVKVDGTISLGTSIEIGASNSSGYNLDSDYRLIKSIFDPFTIVVESYTSKSSAADSSVYSTDQYMVLCFNAKSNTYTTITSLTSLGTWYAYPENSAGKTVTDVRIAFNKNYTNPKKISDTSLKFYGFNGDSNKALPLIYVYKDTYNSSNEVTSSSYALYICSGIYRSAMSKINSSDATFPLKIYAEMQYGSSCFIVLNKAKSIAYLIYFPTRRSTETIPLNWYEDSSVAEVWKFDFLTPNLIKTNLTVADIIDDLIL